MQDVNVVVVFQSRLVPIETGSAEPGLTERLALAAAVGAVQGRANIRLRRLPDGVDEVAGAEYIAPRDSDALWADAIIAGMPAGPCSLSSEFERYFDSLRALRDQGNLHGKVGASFTHGFAADALLMAMRRAGLTTVADIPDPDALTAARLQGRRVAEAARALKNAG
jgi:multimeric flavodoxin WrbA